MDGDSFKFLEFNCDSPGGAFFSDLQVSFLQKLKIMEKLAEKYEFILNRQENVSFKLL